MSRTRAGLLLAATAVAFLPGLSDEFVFDDHRFISGNPALDDPVANLVRYFTDVGSMTQAQESPGWDDIYRPLRTLSFAVDRWLFGDRAFFYRVENLLLHLLAVLLAWRLLTRLLGDPRLGVLGAGIFALHPLSVQTVSFASSRGDLLSAVFLLGGALFLLREDATAARSAAGTALYLLALFSKESAIALLALVPLYDLLMPPRPRLRKGTLLALGAVTAGFLAARFSVAGGQAGMTAEGLLAVGPATLLLAKETLLPVRLLPFTGEVDFPGAGAFLGVVSWAVLLAAAALALARGRRAPRAAFGFLWAAVCLAPVSGIVPIKALAEARYAYLPLVGVGLLLALLVRRTGRAGMALGLTACLLLAAHTFRESRVWRGDLRLWETATVRETVVFGRPGRISLTNLGIRRARSGDHAGAVACFEAVLAIRPSADAFANLSAAQLGLGELEAAFASARRALDLNPENGMARRCFGRSLLGLGRPEEALRYLGRPETLRVLREAAKAAGRSPRDRLLIGEGLRACGAYGEALVEFRRAADLDPDDPEPLVLAGASLLDSGRPEAAMRELSRALALDPGNPIARAERIAAAAMLRGAPPPWSVEALRESVAEILQRGNPRAVVRVLSRPVIREIGDAGAPASFALRLLLARAYRAEGREEDALRAAHAAEARAATAEERAEARRFIEGR